METCYTSEHVIRNEEETNRIREYIIDNHMKWIEDKYNLVSIINSGGSHYATAISMR
jgi:hypothetical protein